MGVAPRSCVVAINREYADERAPVRTGDEVALVPPVSGGAPGVVRSARATAEPLDLAAVAPAVRDTSAGAAMPFVGVTPPIPELHYTAYAQRGVELLRMISQVVA